MPLRLSTAFLRRLKLEEGLQVELERAQDRLPSRVAEEAVEGRTREYAERIAGLCAAGFEPAAQEIIWMPKAYLRYRPLSALPLAERVIFRAFADDLVRSVAPLDAYADTRDSFERDILEADESFTHFGVADVTSFYRYVPHRLLATRIVETTGRADLADAVFSFLAGVMQSDVGVPQNVGPSDQFADLVIAPIERRLIRQGFAVSRYNDDFRIAGRGNRHVRFGLEALQNELHSIGLTLNDAKTTILLRDTFAAHVEQVAGAGYEDAGDLGDAPATQALLRSTTTMLRSALRASKTKTSRLQETQSLDNVRRALRRLTRWKDPSALKHGQAIINRYPSLTQHYARYCATLVEDGRGAEVAEYLNQVFPKLILTPWQELWLLEPVIAGASPLGEKLKRWIVRRSSEVDSPPALRARSALAGATTDLVDGSTALALLDLLPEAARPDAIAAYATTGGKDPDPKEALAGLPDSMLASWICDRYI